MTEQIKELRIKIDGLAQLVDRLQCNKDPYDLTWQSRQVIAAKDSLYLAKAWLGKVLGQIGEDNPYGSGYKTVEDIKPTADVATIDTGMAVVDKSTGEADDTVGWINKSHIEKVDWLRQEINKLMPISVEAPRTVQVRGELFQLLNYVVQHLCEAIFWLGFELERIKNESNK